MHYLVDTIICLLSVAVITSQDCLNLDVHVTQNVGKNGFHRTLRWLIETPSLDEEAWKASGCKLCLRLDLSTAMFVNPDEINDLKRLGRLQAHIEGEIDIEKPAHEATEHTIYVYFPNDTVKRVLLELPVHLRYQRAQITGGFGKVPLHKPILLVYCPENFSKTCGKGLKVEAPCLDRSDEICIWKNLTYNSLMEETELFVPVGDLDDYPVVSIVTLLLGCAGCIYILSVLSTRRI